MFELEKKKMLKACLQMKESKLISLSGGNVSMRVEDGMYIITPSGMLYEEMSISDMVVVDEMGKIIEGDRKPSSDIDALLYIFKNKPGVNAIIHTHQPYATAIGLVSDKLPATLVTIIDANHADVNVAPWTPSSNLGMGILAVEYCGDATAVIMKHHGVIAFGATIEDALFSAVYLEESAQTYVLAKMMGEVPILPQEEIEKEKAGWALYGQ